ncbi:MAG: type II toxin-antitoxin system PemK/MazF family toxin [Coriobacteriia bacterium]|nr:type II toxin-antitoxin system PemK/MazF family toxin [Coriobacteriia bacterium]
MIYSQGDIVYFDYNPTKGHEPAGNRPSVIVSNDDFNNRTSLALVCPITKTNNGFPLHFRIPDGREVTGFVCAEQVRTIDLYARNSKVVGRLDEATLEDIITALRLFL